MSQFQESFSAIVSNFQGNGSFCVHDEINFIPPGLVIDEIGEIGFPLEVNSAQKIISVSQKAPFGLGSKTIVDESVRKTWELDPQFFKLNNPEWKNSIQSILEQTCEALDIDSKTATASLYKLLIYEEGGFFKTHKDSEKEDGMFGTLTVNLPSNFEGGELNITFDDEEIIVDFSKTSNYKIAFAAFFADCDHEIKPLKKGYKLSLVYNLLLDKSIPQMKLVSNSVNVKQVSDLLKANMNEFSEQANVFLLDHQYTPANFEENTLKLKDKLIVQTVLEAAKEVGFYAKPYLFTHYVMGELESDYDYSNRYNSRWKSDVVTETSGDMGEVYEEYSQLEYWMKEGMPSIGILDESEVQVINPIKYDEDSPIDEHEEGFTGNAGMTKEYWYHYAAIVLFPMNKIDGYIDGATEDVVLDWLNYISETKNYDDIEFINSLLTSLERGLNTFKDRFSKSKALDYTIFAHLLIEINDEDLFLKASHILIHRFENIESKKLIELISTIPAQLRIEILSKTIERNDVKVINSFLETFHISILEKHTEATEFFTSYCKMVIENFPAIFKKASEKEHKIEIIVNSILILDNLKIDDLNSVFINVIERIIDRDFIHKNAFNALNRLKDKQLFLAKKLVDLCVSELDKRILNKPQYPADWKREFPIDTIKTTEWNVLIPFLSSPTEELLEYRKAEGYRRAMEHVIRTSKIDVDYTTVKKGSPHTLLIKKNTASYHKNLSKWQEDVNLRNGFMF